MDLDSIKRSPLFHELYDQEIEKILADCCVVMFEPGDFVIRQDDVGSELFIVLKGRVEVLKRKENSEDVVQLAVLETGDIFGEMVLINDNKRSSSIRSLGAAEILVVESSKIFDLFETNTKAFALLVFNMARLLVRRLGKPAK